MQKALINTLKSSRFWLSAGVLFWAASVLLGYHQDQMIAESALAQKIEVPKQVLIQEFSSQNENELSEVNVLAEADLDHAVRIDVGVEAPRLIDAVPLYPVSRASLPVARSLLVDVRRRPVSRLEAGSIAERNRQLSRIEDITVGLVILEADAGTLGPTLDDVTVMGGERPLIDLSGVHSEASGIVESAAGPLAQQGVTLIHDPLVISPRLEDRNGDVSDYSNLISTLFWMSAAMVTFGWASLFLAPIFSTSKSSKTKRPVKEVGFFPMVDAFQPIADQEELGDEDDESPTRKASRIMTIAANVFRTKSRP